VRHEVSVLTIAKGRRQHLSALVEGLAGSSTYPASFVLADFDDEPASLPALPFSVEHIHRPAEGLPLAEARNQAAALANTNFLAFLDVDCIPAPSFVSVMADILMRENALVCCEVLYLPRGTERGLGAESLYQLGQRHPHRPFPRGTQREANAGLFWSLAFGIRRSTFLSLGGFDTAFTGYGAEDTDFAFRAAKQGIPLILTDETRVFHQYHQVFDPPLQHFADILANAQRFRARHGFWPMEGWLRSFATMGLIEWEPDGVLRLLRSPSREEISSAAVSEERPF